MLRYILLAVLGLLMSACQTEQDVFNNLQTEAGATARYAVDKSTADQWKLSILVSDVDEPKRLGAILAYLLAQVAAERNSDKFQAIRSKGKAWYRGWEDDLSGGADPRRDKLLGWVLNYNLNFNFDTYPQQPKSKGVLAVASTKDLIKKARIPHGVDFKRCEGVKPYC